MIKKILLPGLVAIFAIISSCSTDFEVLEDWKETMVIYGVLNPNDTAHYIKVTKAFLGEGDAFMMAKNRDSLFYDPEKLVVTLTTVETGFTDTLDPVTYIPKDMNNNPIFGEEQVLYMTQNPISSSYTYQVRAKNLDTGHEAVAQTKIVKAAAVTTPSSSSYLVDFASATSNFEFKWRTGQNAKRYEAVIRFYYNEKNKTTLAVRSDSIDFNLGEVEAPTANGGENLEIGFVRNQFFKSIDESGKVPPDANLERHPKGVKFILYSAAEELHTYMLVSAPSTGIVQEKPFYTNVTNGYGIFSSRYNQHAMSGNSATNPYYPDAFMMNAATLDSLCAGSITGDNNFCDPATFIPTDPCYCD